MTMCAQGSARNEPGSVVVDAEQRTRRFDRLFVGGFAGLAYAHAGIVQQFFHQGRGCVFEYLVAVGALAEPAARLGQDLSAHRLRLVAQGRDQRCRPLGAFYRQIPADLLVEDTVCIDGRGFPVVLPFEDHPVEVVDRVQVHVVQFADCRVDITRYGNVHGKHRSPAARFQRAFDLVECNHRFGACR